MKQILLAIFILGICLSACHTKKAKVLHGDPQTFDEFKSMFTPAAAPFKLPADTLAIKLPDSLALKPATVQRFLNDTIGQHAFAPGVKRHFYPLYYFQTGEKDNIIQYLVLKVSGSGQSLAYLCIASKKGVYLNSLPVGRVSNADQQVQYFSLDSKSTIRVTTEDQVNGQTAQKEEVFAAYPDGRIALILTNSSGPVSPEKAFNPIDTLPRKHKLSGDYAAGSDGVISIRDGKDAKTFLFFISFSKNKGGCTGELNGTGTFTGVNKGEYKDKSSSCGITFRFSAGAVNIKEEGGCGAYRGIKCFFDGVYVKKIKKGSK
ncbi:hypothetical protein GA0116948_105168 [Chitinophaga costaii]|uniref:Uncharacterized protein n=1 Tax=Chitinophaga costaii TaxID=1335309 RepID=A0A1C4DAF4_9BACT|nr:hypothetical protein [Chitinophaga costaii]SCC28375.1 hypothetical protein GA0116948_105168 [Chitinophaga costaii]